MKSITLAKKDFCTGCLACANVCSQNAIRILTEQEGFYYPYILKDKCTKCGKCMDVCYILNNNLKSNKDCDKFYFGKNSNTKKQETSQSGGAFWAIAEYIYSGKGVVYGAALDDKFQTRHVRTLNAETGKKLKGSKYVQSYIGNTYRRAQRDLKNGRKVLFSGTPCQIAGLYSYLNTKRESIENLFTCDLICHGVPSPRIFHSYLKFMEDKYYKKVARFNFRDKAFGWGSHLESFTYHDTSSISKHYYADLFYNNCILRPSCGNCKFCNCNRVSDITIGDCWGIEKFNPRYFDEKGVSLILINTKKGEDILEKITPFLTYSKIEKRFVMQRNLKEPTEVSPIREKFWSCYLNKGFGTVLRKYTSYGIINRLKLMIFKEL